MTFIFAYYGLRVSKSACGIHIFYITVNLEILAAVADKTAILIFIKITYNDIYVMM